MSNQDRDKVAVTTQCDHIIGEWEGVDESGSVRLSSEDAFGDYISVLYSWCPLCGSRLNDGYFGERATQCLE